MCQRILNFVYLFFVSSSIRCFFDGKEYKHMSKESRSKKDKKKTHAYMHIYMKTKQNITKHKESNRKIIEKWRNICNFNTSRGKIHWTVVFFCAAVAVAVAFVIFVVIQSRLENRVLMIVKRPMLIGFRKLDALSTANEWVLKNTKQ